MLKLFSMQPFGPIFPGNFQFTPTLSTHDFDEFSVTDMHFAVGAVPAPESLASPVINMLPTPRLDASLTDDDTLNAGFLDSLPMD